MPNPDAEGRNLLKIVKRFAPLIALLTILALAFFFRVDRYLSLQSFLESRQMLKSAVDMHFFVASLLYIALYTGLVAIAFPAASLVTIAAGFVFGWFIGGVLTVIGATLGATAIFLAARYAFADLLKARAGGAIDRFAKGFRDDAFSYLLVLRLTPVLPFFAVNIAPAFFDIPLRTYVITTFFGIIPGSMVYTFLGSGIDRTLSRIGGSGPIEVADLITPELTGALIGLGALAVLGLVLKKTVLKRRHPA